MHQDSRGAPVKILQQRIGPFSTQKLLTLSAFIPNTKIEFLLCFIFYFFPSQRLEGKRTDPVTPPIPYFGLVVPAVNGIP